MPNQGQYEKIHASSGPVFRGKVRTSMGNQYSANANDGLKTPNFDALVRLYKVISNLELRIDDGT
jgi:hypothetical protein